MRVSPETAPDAYGELKARWLALVSETSADSQIVRGPADFIAAESVDEAKRLIRLAIDQTPADAQLWLDLGRMSEDPHERLSAFERAREAGNSLRNLLVWIAMTAIKAGDHRRADQAARELMQLVEDARAQFGDKLDWRERGGALWKRAREICPTDGAASELTDAIAQHAYRKHWGHTGLGLLACHEGDLDRAVVHLHASRRAGMDDFSDGATASGIRLTVT